MALDLKGKRFGRLLVVERAPAIRGARNAFWKCMCDCGKAATAAAANIGRTTFSCGCLAKETAAELLKNARYTQTHGMSHTPEHDTWLKIQQRCYNPNDKKYPRYGARGIVVCQRWLDDFANFYADMGPRPSAKHSIDRYPDNDGPYSPENCRWATAKQQARNRGITKTVTIDGIEMPIAEWCEIMGIKRSRVAGMSRSQNGRPARFPTEEDAIKWIHANQKSSSHGL